jgi:hypothetical protein
MVFKHTSYFNANSVLQDYLSLKLLLYVGTIQIPLSIMESLTSRAYSVHLSCERLLCFSTLLRTAYSASNATTYGGILRDNLTDALCHRSVAPD